MPDLSLISSDTKRTLLHLMKQAGEISLDDAMAETGYARTTIREHLQQLERDGLVERRSKKEGRGRPRMLYRTTPLAEGLFPSREGVLLRELLRFLQADEKEELVEDFFRSFWVRRTREVEHRLDQSQLEDTTENRLEVLSQMLQEEGFMPEINREGDQITVRECNCPFSEAVRATRLPCQLEARFYEEVFKTTMERVSYIPDGHAACTYEFKPSE